MWLLRNYPPHDPVFKRDMIIKFMAENLPYVNATNKLVELLNGVKNAGVPPKFNRDFVSSVLNLKSSTFLSMIPFLKRLGLIDQANVPTQDYKDFRDENMSKVIMAKCIKNAYEPLFQAHEYANRLTKSQVKEKIKNITGMPADSKTLDAIASTFIELVKQSDFESKILPKEKEEKEEKENISTPELFQGKFGINYTINLNLPATTEIEVFNAIFKSLKEHLMRE